MNNITGPRTLLGRTILFGAASLLALRNPQRGDLVATVGELTAQAALQKLRVRLAQSPQGRKILKERPYISEETICREALSRLPPNTFGYRYYQFLQKHHFSPSERAQVRFIQDEELAFIMQRYRQVHDFWHVLTEIPPTVEGEVLLKWFEAFHTGLPFCYLSGMGGSLLLLSKTQTAHLIREDIPWAFHTATHCSDLLCVEYEKRFDNDFLGFQEELGLSSYRFR